MNIIDITVSLSAKEFINFDSLGRCERYIRSNKNEIAMMLMIHLFSAKTQKFKINADTAIETAISVPR
jgi:hypothetical protein